MNISPHSPRDVRSMAQGRRATQVHGDSGATETVDLTEGSVHHVTLSANCTFTFSVPSGAESDGWEFYLFCKQDATGSRTVTWPASVDWPAATAPTLTTTAAKTDGFRFVTTNGGTSWFGSTIALNYTE